jgi:hypothetical protein
MTIPLKLKIAIFALPKNLNPEMQKATGTDGFNFSQNVKSESSEVLPFPAKTREASSSQSNNPLQRLKKARRSENT